MSIGWPQTVTQKEFYTGAVKKILLQEVIQRKPQNFNVWTHVQNE